MCKTKNCGNPGCSGGCNKSTHYNPIPKLSRSTEINHVGCYSGCNKTKYLPEEQHPLCSKNSSSLNCFEEVCDEETFDLKQVRYKISCDDFSKLENLNIGVGDNLEYIIETMGKRIEDFSYLSSPVVNSMPTLDSYEKIINYLFAKIEDLQLQINSK